MNPAALLALGSSLGWGLSDYLGGRRSRTLTTLTVLIVSQLASLLILATGVVVLGAAPPPPTAVRTTAVFFETPDANLPSAREL